MEIRRFKVEYDSSSGSSAAGRHIYGKFAAAPPKHKAEQIHANAEDGTSITSKIPEDPHQMAVDEEGSSSTLARSSTSSTRKIGEKRPREGKQ